MTVEIPQVLVGALLGLVYGAAGLARQHGDGMEVSAKRIVRRVLLFTIAGAVVATADGDLTQGAIEAQVTAIGGSLGIAFDMFWSRYVEQGAIE